MTKDTAAPVRALVVISARPWDMYCMHILSPHPQNAPRVRGWYSTFPGPIVKVLP